MGVQRAVTTPPLCAVALPRPGSPVGVALASSSGDALAAWGWPAGVGGGGLLAVPGHSASSYGQRRGKHWVALATA